VKQLPLVEGRAVGGPIARGLLASYFAVALGGLLAASVALVLAAPDLAAGGLLAPRVVLATHLVALGFLPFAVTAASFHLLPVLLRNDAAHPRLLVAALPLLGGGFLLAPGVAYDRDTLAWIGVALVAAGLACVLEELLGLVRRAPRNRTLVASRVGIALVALHVTAALVLGGVMVDRGVGRWPLVHLHLAIVGWLALLIVSVGRTLGPMLALAPTEPARRVPVLELVLTAGLWLLLAGLAGGWRWLSGVGGAVALLSLAAFGRTMLRVARERRLPVEAPLAHLLAGVLFLAQAAVLGFLLLADAVPLWRGLIPYVVLLLVGWGAGVTLGHLGKLLSLSLWVWWPAGPRPKQEHLYPRRLGLGSAALFSVGVELVAVGALMRSSVVVRVGAVLTVLGTLAATAGAVVTWSRRSR
jgi:hypothetical protein